MVKRKRRRDRRTKKGHQEPQFDFWQAKTWLLVKSFCRNEEVEAGYCWGQYLRQATHQTAPWRNQADKFETRQFKRRTASTQRNLEMIQEVRESKWIFWSDVTWLWLRIYWRDRKWKTTQFVPPLPDKKKSAEIEPLVLTETEPKEIMRSRKRRPIHL